MSRPDRRRTDRAMLRGTGQRTRQADRPEPPVDPTPGRTRPARARPPAVHAAEYQYMLRRLREVRRALGLTQSQVAAALGRPISYVSKCELGERRIDPIDLLHFARTYRHPLTAFLPDLGDA
jgi:hypothetical protein